VKRLLLGLTSIGLLATASLAHAEIAVMASGKILYIDSYHREDETITLYLTGGGEVTVPSELVANIVPNEIVEGNETELATLQLLPQLDELITPVAERYGLEPNLVAAVVWVESSGDPKAVSRKGASGLMQLMPDTAEALGVGDVFDPAQNLEGGVRYFKKLLDQHQQDLSLALAAYNAGPQAVARHGGIPPYSETEHYVKRVLELYRGEEAPDS
jgi:soluble lytic murein transglycosylase-like protein